MNAGNGLYLRDPLSAAPQPMEYGAPRATRGRFPSEYPLDRAAVGTIRGIFTVQSYDRRRLGGSP